MDPRGKGMVVTDKEKESFVNDPKDDKPTDSDSSHKRKDGKKKKKTRRIKEIVYYDDSDESSYSQKDDDNYEKKKTVNSNFSQQSVPPYFLRPPGDVWSGRAACGPLALVRGTGNCRRNSGGHISWLGATARRTGNVDPSVGIPITGLADRHTTLIEGRQTGQDR
jgi:hypothetical protein